MSEWIKCSDALPENDVYVDTYCTTIFAGSEIGRIPDCKIIDGEWRYFNEEQGDVSYSAFIYKLQPTHWMPLPSPPEDSQ